MTEPWVFNDEALKQLDEFQRRCLNRLLAERLGIPMELAETTVLHVPDAVDNTTPPTNVNENTKVPKEEFAPTISDQLWNDDCVTIPEDNDEQQTAAAKRQAEVKEEQTTAAKRSLAHYCAHTLLPSI